MGDTHEDVFPIMSGGCLRTHYSHIVQQTGGKHELETLRTKMDTLIPIMQETRKQASCQHEKPLSEVLRPPHIHEREQQKREAAGAR